MPVQINLPDTRYDYTHPWYNNLQDKVEYERAFSGGSYQDRTIAQAMITANPVTPNAEISEKMTIPGVPDRFGYRIDEKGIMDVLDNNLEDAHLNDMHTTDFSGKRSGMESSSVPSLPMW